MTTLQTRVRKGARLLDKESPGWIDKINLKKLNVDSMDNCILAQIYGGFVTGIDTLKLKYNAPSDYGFDGHEADRQSLTSIWNDLILSRREKIAIS